MAIPCFCATLCWENWQLLTWRRINSTASAMQSVEGNLKDLGSKGFPISSNTQVDVIVRKHWHHIPGNRQRTCWEWTLFVQALTESNDIGHIWSKFGNDIGKVMAHIMFNIWIWYRLLPSISNPCGAAVFYFCSIYCLLLWHGYVLRKVPYILQSVWFGNGKGVSHVNTTCSWPCLWYCYVFRKVPYNSHSSCVFVLLFVLLFTPFTPFTLLQSDMPTSVMGLLWNLLSPILKP